MSKKILQQQRADDYRHLFVMALIITAAAGMTAVVMMFVLVLFGVILMATVAPAIVVLGLAAGVGMVIVPALAVATKAGFDALSSFFSKDDDTAPEPTVKSGHGYGHVTNTLAARNSASNAPVAEKTFKERFIDESFIGKLASKCASFFAARVESIEETKQNTYNNLHGL